MAYFRFLSDLFYFITKLCFIWFRNETIFAFGKAAVPYCILFNLSLNVMC